MMRVRVEAHGAGAHLNVERWGQVKSQSREDEPLVLLHGFTGSAETWEPFARTLGARFSLVAVDLLGHGCSDSPVDSERYRIDRCVEDLLTLLDRLQLERIHLLGYSLGGRVALHLALAAPERVGTLVLESASPGLGDPSERAARLKADAELASLLERDGVEAFVDRWERHPLFATQNRLPSDVRSRLRAQRLRSNPAGLAGSLRGAGAGAQEALHERLREVRQPALLLVGELDSKYREMGRFMAAAMPEATLVVVPNSGHAIHLEQPAFFEQYVLDFLEPDTTGVAQPSVAAMGETV
jgi:2-succinyl-6-hydroxy-2,4-cyclohexadiene-1-carboxylate synthase